MDYILDLDSLDCSGIFKKVLSKINNKKNLYIEIRKEVSKSIAKEFFKTGLEVKLVEEISCNIYMNPHELDLLPSEYESPYLSLEFCSSYGVGPHTISALNYQHRDYLNVPSLATFGDVESFTIGNIGFLLNKSDFNIVIKQSKTVKIAGYTYNNSKSKKWKPLFMAFIGIHFDKDCLAHIISQYSNSNNCLKNLKEIIIANSSIPAIFVNIFTGKLYTCNCFKGYFDIQRDILDFAYITEQKLLNKINNIGFLDNICFLCTHKKPSVIRRASGVSSFYQRYEPYIILDSIKRYGNKWYFIDGGQEYENELREKFNVYKIGERWVHETLLYKIVCELFPSKTVLFHYRGEELSGQEIDVFIPELKIGMEYQGIQHFFPIKQWGGEEGLEERQEADKIKKEKCKKLGYELIEFTWDENISINLVKDKLELITKRQTNR